MSIQVKSSQVKSDHFLSPCFLSAIPFCLSKRRSFADILVFEFEFESEAEAEAEALLVEAGEPGAVEMLPTLISSRELLLLLALLFLGAGDANSDSLRTSEPIEPTEPTEAADATDATDDWSETLLSTLLLPLLPEASSSNCETLGATGLI